MKVCSNSNLTLSPTFFSTGSRSAVAAEPPRSSSQFADQETFMFCPEIKDFGRATGVCCWAGASVSVA
jgi:hypothetical protein